MQNSCSRQKKKFQKKLAKSEEQVEAAQKKSECQAEEYEWYECDVHCDLEALCDQLGVNSLKDYTEIIVRRLNTQDSM